VTPIRNEQSVVVLFLCTFRDITAFKVCTPIKELNVGILQTVVYFCADAITLLGIHMYPLAYGQYLLTRGKFILAICKNGGCFSFLNLHITQKYCTKSILFSGIALRSDLSILVVF
jgi:hypothetical protein